MCQLNHIEDVGETKTAFEGLSQQAKETETHRSGFIRTANHC